MPQSDVRFFDEIAPKWDSLINVSPEKINHILKVAKIHPGDSVLDVGTGTGVLIPFMLSILGEKDEITAVDISEGMLREAIKKYSDHKNVTFLLADIESETMDRQYDRIVMYCMYPHLSYPEDTVEWLAKVNLNPEGTMIIAFPESKESINAIHHHNDGSVHSVHLIDGAIFKAQLESRGLTVYHIEDSEDYYIVGIVKK